jgi:hypothetical protein
MASTLAVPWHSYYHRLILSQSSKGKRAARKLKLAQILPAADAGCSDEEIARAVGEGGANVYRTKRRFQGQPYMTAVANNLRRSCLLPNINIPASPP